MWRSDIQLEDVVSWFIFFFFCTFARTDKQSKTIHRFGWWVKVCLDTSSKLWRFICPMSFVKFDFQPTLNYALCALHSAVHAVSAYLIYVCNVGWYSGMVHPIDFNMRLWDREDRISGDARITWPCIAQTWIFPEASISICAHQVLVYTYYLRHNTLSQAAFLLRYQVGASSRPTAAASRLHLSVLSLSFLLVKLSPLSNLFCSISQ